MLRFGNSLAWMERKQRSKAAEFLGRGKQDMQRPSGKCMLSRSGTHRVARVARGGKEGGRVVGFREDEETR